MVATLSFDRLKPDQRLATAIRDLIGGLERWHIWWVLATLDIKQRYRRSRIGQFWLTISMALTVGILGVVYPLILHTPIVHYAPNLAASFVCWSLISGLIVEGATTFVQSANFLKQSSDPRSIYVYRVIARNVLIFAHNAVVIVGAFAIFEIVPTWIAFESLLGLALLLVASVWIVLLVGTLCTRFRDLPQIIGSVMQIAFFVTPIVWQPTMLPKSSHWLIIFNPFAAFLSVIRDPLMGVQPTAEAWVMTTALAFGGYLFTVPFFAQFRARIVYWL